jgi:4-amino-4-deoxy-L-arabinose transferase-like glycosyltransferase
MEAHRMNLSETQSARYKFFSAHNLWFLFWTAFLLRVLVITLGHTYHVRPGWDHFQFGWEMGRVARALATGYGYANPFVGHTGPTAWVPPLYPLLIAAVFKLTGVYTAGSAWLILTLNSVFSAATAPLIYKIASRCYNRRVAVWSAWLWVLYPAFMQYAVHWIWDMALTAMLFSLALLLAVKMRGIGSAPDAPSKQTTRNWLLFALLWALIAYSNPSLLLFLPACGIWILIGARPFSRGFLNATVAALCFLALLAPWTIRNYRVFHHLIPMRDNLGAEMEAANGPGSNGLEVEAATLPLAARARRTMLYSFLGEYQYSKRMGQKADTYIAAHPAHYAAITLKRFYFYWVSVPHPLGRHPSNEYIRELNYCFFSITGILGLALSLHRRIPAAKMFLWAFLLLPVTYYLIIANARYRHPLEPLICIFTVYLFQSAEPRKPKAS